MRIYIYLFAVCLCIIQSLFPQENMKLNSPYRTNWTNDGIIIGTSILVAFSASAIDDGIIPLTVAEINSLKKNEINPIDRITSGFYSKEQSMISDILVGTSIVSPLFLMFDENIRSDAGTIGTMYFETIFLATFTPSFGKGGVKRIRPYLYGNKAPLSEKLNTDARRSFFSGHATWAFATSIFFANVYSDYYPSSKYKNYIWYGSIVLASSVSILRVTSGAHFISDIIVGAAVGSAIGFVIPYLHRNNSEDISFSPHFSPQYRGISLSLHL